MREHGRGRREREGGRRVRRECDGEKEGESEREHGREGVLRCKKKEGKKETTRKCDKDVGDRERKGGRRERDRWGQ